MQASRAIMLQGFSRTIHTWIRRGRPVVAALLLVMAATVQASGLTAGKDYLLVGEPTDDQAPVRACDAAVLDTLDQHVQIPAPAGGWSGAPQAVEVFNVFYGEVMISHGDRQVCGHMQDVRTRDSRFRSGIGMVLVPKPGDTAPIEVSWSRPLKVHWIPTVRLGAPSPLQQEDTARLLVRAACVAIALALALSALMGFATTGDRSFVVYVGVCGLLVIWQAVFSGLSGYPWPWLPIHDAGMWLIALSSAAVGVVVHILWRLCGGAHQWPRSRWFARGQLIALLIVALAVPFAPPLLSSTVATVLDFYLALACMAVAGVGVSSLSNREVDAVDGVVAVVPLLVAIVAEWAGFDVLVEYRIEILQLAVTWLLMITAYSLNRRLGQMRRQRDELKYLAETDSLTGLPNRRAGLSQLTSYLQAAAKAGTPLSIGFLDIDHFKQINDRYGHDVGDEVLVAVGKVLSASVRDQRDVVRMGGEEFLVMLPGADAEVAMKRLQTLRERMSEVGPQLSQKGMNVTASIGLADFQTTTDDVTSLLRRADEAMYLAKNGGRNQVVYAGPGCAIDTDIAAA